ncbi:MAG: hypothetical protein RIC55_09390 [Pirellulaceae bacterium]
MDLHSCGGTGLATISCRAHASTLSFCFVPHLRKSMMIQSLLHVLGNLAMFPVRAIQRLWGWLMAAVRWLWECVIVGLQRLFGCHLNGFDDEGQGYATFTWLFGQFLAQSAAVGAFDRFASVQQFTFWSYVVLTLIVVGGMVIMLCASKGSGSAAVHAFDKGSIVFGRWVLCWTLAIGLAFGIALASGAFRSEVQQHTLSITDVKDATWHDEQEPKMQEGIKFDITLFPKAFGEEGVPPKLTMLITQSGALSNDWSVDVVDGYTLDEDGHEHAMFPPPAVERESANPKLVELRKLAPMFTYRFRVFLHRVHADGMSRQQAQKLIKDAGIKVYVQEPG